MATKKRKPASTEADIEASAHTTTDTPDGEAAEVLEPAEPGGVEQEQRLDHSLWASVNT